jgi:HD-GYP domain-containing protein (c-di-GMP phosphodiesterase class II)
MTAAAVGGICLVTEDLFSRSLAAALAAGAIVAAFGAGRRSGAGEATRLSASAPDTGLGVTHEQHFAEAFARVVDYIEARDRYAVGHSRRVAELAERIALEMGLPSERALLMHWAGRLHDIGMIAVPVEMLRTTESFGRLQRGRLELHCRASQEILRPLSFLEPVLPAVHMHHERLNGTGYPRGLSGEQIPLEARILAVADAFEAMTHDRPHRPAMLPATALAELMRCTPAGYDPDCVRALEKVAHLCEHPAPETRDREKERVA